MKAVDVAGDDFWSWVDRHDQMMNPEAHAYGRQNAPRESTSATPVVTKIPNNEPKFTVRAHREREPSSGWRGRVRAQYRAGHITREQALQRLGQDPAPKSRPRSAPR